MRWLSAVVLVLGAGIACSDGSAPAAGEPERLSAAGLYQDMAERILAPGSIELEPRHQLWSDGAVKRRFLQLPPGGRIDTSDMEHWRFPVGTRVWKEFSQDGALLETRLIERTGPGDGDTWMGAFVWLPDASDAIFRPDGAPDINGTQHDAPPAKQCPACHGGEPGRILGLSAVQLRGEGRGVRLQELADRGLLSHAPAPDLPSAAPGSPVAAAALGYLHANCGHCHSRGGLAFRDTDLVLRLSAGDRAVEATGAARTAVGVMMQKRLAGSGGLRIQPGSPETSGVLARMGTRSGADPAAQMPPLATERIDEQGIAAVTEWIRSLPADHPPR